MPEITETSCEEFGDADKMPEVKFLNTSLASSPASEKG